MSDYFSEENSVEIVNGRIAADVDPRLGRIMRSLVKHLHAFVKDVELTEQEWEAAVAFLTRTGQICSGERQEFILLSDVLGISMLVDAINHRRSNAATENTVFGPFHVDGAPERPMGTNICLDGMGETCRFEGRVLDTAGMPIKDALIDVWSDNADGFYDVQQPGVQPAMNNRGIFRTGPDGHYIFVGIKPVPYPIPSDGPVGKILESLGRQPYRPAHMHFRITAEGFEPLTTHIFVAGDPYIESDAVFGVKKTLIAEFNTSSDGQVDWVADFDFILEPNSHSSAPQGKFRQRPVRSRRHTPPDSPSANFGFQAGSDSYAVNGIPG